MEQNLCSMQNVNKPECLAKEMLVWTFSGGSTCVHDYWEIKVNSLAISRVLKSPSERLFAIFFYQCLLRGAKNDEHLI